MVEIDMGGKGFKPHDELYHINIIGRHNRHHPLNPGEKLSTNKDFNPFFSYYQNPFTMSYKKKTGETSTCSPLSMFCNLHNHTLHDYVCPPTYNELAGVAYEHCAEYVKFSKELLWELTRERHFKHRPSRMKCIWLLEDVTQAKSWITKLGCRDFQLLRVELLDIHSIFRADEKYFTMENEGYSILEDRSKDYWRGVDDASDSTEILFEGTLEVKSLEDFSTEPEAIKS